MILEEPNVFKKIQQIEEACHRLLVDPHASSIPYEPARDVDVVTLQAMPSRPGLANPKGQIRLLHDLANIELQAMELGLRTLAEFHQAPRQFREELAQITIEESTHLKMCLDAIESLGGSWGDCPVHLGLWGAVSQHDHLLERVFIVHRYLESSGLDAGEGLLRRLTGIPNKQISHVVKKIVDEEIGHVEFGSRWYFELCRRERIDAFEFYKRATQVLVKTNPRKETVSFPLRKRAGYEERELVYLAEQKRRNH